MAQTTAGMSGIANKVEISTNGSSYTDISGFAASVTPDGGARKVGKGFTFDGDTPLLVKGKREHIGIKIRVVYTEGGSDPFEVVRAAYEAGNQFWTRYSPKGGVSGDFQYTITGFIVTAPYPMAEAESEAPLYFEYDMEASSISKAVVV